MTASASSAKCHAGGGPLERSVRPHSQGIAPSVGQPEADILLPVGPKHSEVLGLNRL